MVPGVQAHVERRAATSAAPHPVLFIALESAADVRFCIGVCRMNVEARPRHEGDIRASGAASESDPEVDAEADAAVCVAQEHQQQRQDRDGSNVRHHV
jgi:hypothetical protein